MLCALVPFKAEYLKAAACEVLCHLHKLFCLPLLHNILC